MGMQALAWDDEPEAYFVSLAKHLELVGITVTICKDPDDFMSRYNDPTGRWDLVITDLVRANYPAFRDKNTVVGVAISQNVRGVPVFMVTGHQNKYDFPKLGIPSHVIVKSKSTLPGFQATEIRDELRWRGLYTDAKKVFLIFGHDRTAAGTSAAVAAHFAAKQVVVIQVAPDSLFTEINHGLVERMRDCAAVVSVCTPDDRVEARKPTDVDNTGPVDVYYQPRQNVLYEMGLALGLGRGLKRLVIVQKKGPTPDQTARLPSDLGGVLPLRFETSVDEVFPALDAKLRELGVDLN